MFCLRNPSKTQVLLLLCLLIILSDARAQQQGPTYDANVCPNTSTYAPNSTYQTNLNQLLSSLSSNVNQSDGYHNATTGQNNPGSTVYGAFLCRGDVTTDTCRDCVSNATVRVLQRCPNETNAVIWYDECLLQYSNESFFSTVQVTPMVLMLNTANITEQKSRFTQLLGDTLNALADETANGGGGTKFATKEANFTSFQTLYTLGQCTPDLSSEDCNRCLQIAIANLNICCSGSPGARSLTPSCYIRFEMYLFYQVLTSAPAPTPLLTYPGKSKTPARTIIAVVVPTGVVLVLLVLLCCWYRNRRARRAHSAVPEQKVDISTAASLQFDLDTIKSATNNFSPESKLGEGGFGEVYKGTLPDGQHIAVKRLSSSSRQGAEQFKTEVVTMARLQHRNLVRLMGFCLDEEEKILVYEFLPNKSLDYFLFESEKGRQLEWPKRYKIIGGIARGILYLHIDSQLRIIHRDLKASNILLDEDLSPKISDFGMAKIVGVDQTQANTSRIVGTYGYMSPEYAMHGQFSIKSDVYSFGVLVLEIISGKKNSAFYISDYAQDLLTYAWTLWREGRQLELLDPALEDSYSRDEAIRCIHIGLLCVQEDPAQRPTIQSILVMLESYSVTLPAPQEPAFFAHARTISNMPQTEQHFDLSTRKSITSSYEESVSEFYPRLGRIGRIKHLWNCQIQHWEVLILKTRLLDASRLVYYVFRKIQQIGHQWQILDLCSTVIRSLCNYLDSRRLSCVERRTPDRQRNDLESDQSTSSTIPWSVNDSSITEVYPR